MKVNSQLHVPAALSPVPIAWEAVWASEPVWTRWLRKKIPLITPSRTEHRSSSL